MRWVVYAFSFYLVLCYLGAIYLVVRLYSGKRLRVLVSGRQTRLTARSEVVKPTSAQSPAAESTSPDARDAKAA